MEVMMYHIIWGVVIGLVVGFFVWDGNKNMYEKRKFLIGAVVVLAVVGGLLGLLRHQAVCNNLTVKSTTSSKGLRDLEGIYGPSSVPLLEKVSTSNSGESAYIYFPENGIVPKTILDSQYDISIVNDDLSQVEIVKFRLSSRFCEMSDTLAIPKDKYVFHVSLDRFLDASGK